MKLYELLEQPPLESPVVILALDGWVDAGLGAQTARAALLQSMETVTVATFDADEILDHRARRPVMHLVDGLLTGLTWATTELRAATDGDGNDLLLLVGSEPDQRWGAFTKAVVDLVLDAGARLVVGLGAYPAPVPHTRPTRLACSASDEHLARFCSVRSTIDVPAGVQGAIERRAAEEGPERRHPLLPGRPELTAARVRKASDTAAREIRTSPPKRADRTPGVPAYK